MAVTNDIVFRVVNLVAAAFMIIGGVAFILQGGTWKKRKDQGQ